MVDTNLYYKPAAMQFGLIRHLWQVQECKHMLEIWGLCRQQVQEQSPDGSSEEAKTTEAEDYFAL